MKILHLTGKDYFGAGRAAYRLHKALQTFGVESQMWVGDKQSNDSTVHQIHKGFLRKLIKKAYIKIEKRQVKVNDSQAMFSNGYWGAKVSDCVNKERPDIVHVHWINRGFISMKDLTKIDVPIVVTMHDMWYFTGGCHITKGCNNYIDTCHFCPQIQKANNQSVPHAIQSYKKEVYGNTYKLTFIGPSTWMAECAGNSSLLGNQSIVNIPNCIDTKFFARKPNSKSILDQCTKKKILIAAVDVLADQNKGFEYIYKAIQSLPANEYALVILGSEGNEQLNHTGMEIINLGYINDDNLLVEYLSAVDVTVVPSRQENLSNMIMESLACETPVVCFRIGGNDNMVEHKQNGYLAEPFVANDLKNGIVWCTESHERTIELGAQARATVEKKFSPNKVAQQHVELYQKIIADK
jgi:glycosyltransferase involved in cell wall biosynthesis